VETFTRIVPTALWWSADAERVLFLSGGDCVVYEVRRDKFLAVPVGIATLLPMSPNGKGFLGVSKAGKKEKIVFVDWEGWITEFKNDPGREKEDRMIGFRWEKNVANFITSKDVREYDTVSMNYLLKRQGPKLMPSEDGDPALMHEFNAGGGLLCSFQKEIKDEKTGLVLRSDDWLEFQIPSERKRKVLIEKSALKSFGNFCPSPDGEKCTVNFSKRPAAGTEEREQLGILVIDNKGSVIASIDLEHK
jgi:hypothetical protein